MRQIGDLFVWVGMIGLAVGVVYYTPIVAEYVTTDRAPRPARVAPAAKARPAPRHAPIAPGATGEWSGERR